VPLAAPGSWFAFDELARRRGDYAIVGMALTGLRRDRVLSDTRIVLMGVDSTPVRARKTEALLNGQVDDETLAATAAASLRAEIDPLPDLTNSPETKRHLAGVLLQRLLNGARA
jgi:aerobic carbon-monoxide dehydrogenase medium subunit